MSRPVVYTCFATDVIHDGHMNILNEAARLGDVTVGILCDSEMVRYNRFPTTSQEERIEMVRSIPCVSNVIVQDMIMYDKVFEQIHPDYVVHGKDWHKRGMQVIRDNTSA